MKMKTKTTMLVALAAAMAMAYGSAMADGTRKAGAKPPTTKTKAAKAKKPVAKPAVKAVVAANPNADHETGFAQQEASERPYIKAGREALAAGRLAEAEAQFRSAGNVGPKDPDGRPWAFVRQPLADVLMRVGRYAEAAELLTETGPRDLPRSRQYPQRWEINRALAALYTGDLRTARTFVDPAGGIEPYYNVPEIMQDAPGVADARHLEATLLLMRTLGASGPTSDSDALADATAADRLVSGNPLISFVCARAYARAQEWARAESYYMVVERAAKSDLKALASKLLYTAKYRADQERARRGPTKKQ